MKDDPEQCCFIPLTASLRKVPRKLDDLDTTLIKFLRSVQLIVQVLDAVDVPSSLVVPAAAAQYTLPDLCDISIQTKIIHITLRLIYIPYLVYLNVSPATHNNAPNIERRGFWKSSLSDLWWLQRRRFTRYKSQSHSTIGEPFIVRNVFSSIEKAPKPYWEERMLEDIKTSFLICAVLPARVL